MNYIKYICILLVILLLGCGEDSSNPVENTPTEIPNKLFEITAEEIKAGSEFQASLSHFEYDVSVYKITYAVNHKAQNITASGVIAIPDGVESPPILIDNHGTLQRDQWAPSYASKSGFIYRFTEFASAGYIVLAPDYIGFGASANVFHPWLLPEPGAEAVVKIIQAGKGILEDHGYSYSEAIFLTGFSEGANIVLGAQRRIEQDKSLNINLVASSPASGAYDMNYTFTNRIIGNTPSEAIGGAYMIITLREVYGWNDPLTTFFKEPYAGELQRLLNEPGTFEDNFFTENVVSIDYATGVLNHDKLYVESFLLDFETNPNNKVKLKLIENNIHMWAPTTPTMLSYGKSDTTTYFQNSLNAHNEFINRGADPSKITIVGYEGKDHEGSENPWMKATLDWFDSFK